MATMGEGCRSVAQNMEIDVSDTNPIESAIPSPVTNKVQVAVRVRPMSNKEEADESNQCCVSVSSDGKQVRMGMDQIFTFDQVFSATAGQEDIFKTSAEPMLVDLFNGYNVTLMAYGQTGSGKTYTMGSDKDQDQSCLGIIPRILSNIFERVDQLAETHEISLKCSLLEIYQDKIRDLLENVPCAVTTSGTRGKSLEPRIDAKGSVNVDGLHHAPLQTSAEAMQVLVEGLEKRQVGSTDMNAVSSRSHAVFAVELDLCPREGTDLNGLESSLKSAFTAKLTFVDLAGSERLKRTNATGSRMAEGIAINQGLSCLGAVINALAVNRGHIPYRDHKLTLLLKDALGGNSRTLFMACLSPAQTNFSETLSSLRYANKVKAIKNKAVVNRSEAEEKMHRMRLHIDALARAYVKEKFGGGFGCSDEDISDLLLQERVKNDLENIREKGMVMTSTMTFKTSSSSFTPKTTQGSRSFFDAIGKSTSSRSLLGRGRSNSTVSTCSTMSAQSKNSAILASRSTSRIAEAAEVARQARQALDISAAQEEMDFLDQELKNARKDAQETEELEAVEGAINENAANIASKERILQKIRDDLVEFQTLQKEHCELALKVESNEKEYAELQAQLAEAEQEMLQAKANNVANNGGKRQKLREQLEIKQKRINQLNSNLRAKVAKLNSLKKTTGTRSKIEEELRELKSKNVDMKRRKAQREKEIRADRKARALELAKQTKLLSGTQRKLQKVQSKGKHKDAQLDRRAKQIAKLTSQLKKAKKQTMALAKRKLAQHTKREERKAGRLNSNASAQHSLDRAHDVVHARRLQAQAVAKLQDLYRQQDRILNSALATAHNAGSNDDASEVEIQDIENRISHQTSILQDSTAHAEQCLSGLVGKSSALKIVLDGITAELAEKTEEGATLHADIRRKARRIEKLSGYKDKLEKEKIHWAGQAKSFKRKFEEVEKEFKASKRGSWKLSKKRSMSQDTGEHEESPYKKHKGSRTVRAMMSGRRQSKKTGSRRQSLGGLRGSSSNSAAQKASFSSGLKTLKEMIGTPMAICGNSEVDEEAGEDADTFDDENGFAKNAEWNGDNGDKLFGNDWGSSGVADMKPPKSVKRKSKRTASRRASLCIAALTPGRKGAGTFHIEAARGKIAQKAERERLKKIQDELEAKEANRRMSVMGTLRGAASRAERTGQGNSNLRNFGRSRAKRDRLSTGSSNSSRSSS